MEKIICNDCVNMRKEDGWCGRVSRYVAALSPAPSKCFVSRSEVEATIAAAPTLKKEDPPIGKPKTRGRAYDVPYGMKYCPSCNRTLSVDCFSNNKSRPDGLSNYCKKCATEKQRVRNIKKRENKKVAKNEKEADAMKRDPGKVTSDKNVTLSQIAPDALVAELRSRGWTVSCTRTVEEEL